MTFLEKIYDREFIVRRLKKFTWILTLYSLSTPEHQIYIYFILTCSHIHLPSRFLWIIWFCSDLNWTLEELCYVHSYWARSLPWKVILDCFTGTQFQFLIVHFRFKRILISRSRVVISVLHVFTSVFRELNWDFSNAISCCRASIWWSEVFGSFSNNRRFLDWIS